MIRRALVVAHPDDETLFFGGLLLACPGDWTIICCTVPRADPVRATKFFDAAKLLGARAAELVRETEPFSSEPLSHLERLALGDFDLIVTHNSVGEYGHAHHIALNRYVAQRWPDKIVTGGYGKAPCAFRVVLDAHQIAMKMAALRCYDHVSPLDGKPKWRALLDRYGTMFDFGVETYDRAFA